MQAEAQQAHPLKCMSCGRKVETEKQWVEFKCPQCTKTSILRCESCKKLENPYECKECGFVGP
ncbi:MAG: RNA-binding protein [Candidatus Aenigmarchaeota archaeon]|nr:RNA-binding protein [Candidatus Aenigmarchaeota archaeon]